jgi:hypothetical protein
MGLQDFQGKCDGTDTATKTKLRIRLDADAGDVLVGGDGRGGDINLRDDTNTIKIRLNAGGAEAPPSPFPVPVAETETISLSGDTGTVSAGGHGQTGSLHLKGDGNEERILLSGAGYVTVGGNDADGSITLLSQAGQRIQLDASGGNIWLGGHDKNGDLMLFPAAAKGAELNDPSKASIRLDGGERRIRLRGYDTKHVLKDRIQLIADRGKIMLGGNGAAGDLLLFKDTGDNETTSQATIWIKGATGDIILQNADCAEDFDVSESEEIEPGTVMVLDQEGRLERSTGAYDKKVAGVISGAGEYKPGIVLDKKESQKHRLPVALMGKAYCKVDAQYSSIEVGDLLTTSPTPGHAMKAKDTLKAFGAVIGKALRPLEAGTGLIPILIALQ